MTPCKFNPFCLCSNNGEKFKLRLEKYRKRWGNLISAVFNIINNIIKFSHFNSIQNKVRLQAGSTSNWTNWVVKKSLIRFHWLTMWFDMFWNWEVWSRAMEEVEMSSYPGFYHLPVTGTARREREGSNTYSSPLQRTLPFSIYNSALCGNAVDKSWMGPYVDRQGYLSAHPPLLRMGIEMWWCLPSSSPHPLVSRLGRALLYLAQWPHSRAPTPV